MTWNLLWLVPLLLTLWRLSGGGGGDEAAGPWPLI